MLNRCRWFLQGGGCFALPTAIGHPHPHVIDGDGDVFGDDDDDGDMKNHQYHLYKYQGDLQGLSREVDHWSPDDDDDDDDWHFDVD